MLKIIFILKKKLRLLFIHFRVVANFKLKIRFSAKLVSNSHCLKLEGILNILIFFCLFLKINSKLIIIFLDSKKNSILINRMILIFLMLKHESDANTRVIYPELGANARFINACLRNLLSRAKNKL